jgi:peptidoglycan/xylan/chitin deacetylase (PgdA/CDA1 family)
MSLRGAKTVKKFSRWVQARVLGGALILGYHRISEVVDDFYQICVAPESFAGQMEALREYAHPVSLSDLVQSLKQNTLAPKSVAVTFDDGYADNLHVAKPILEKYKIPATIFVCTGFAGREFWWDELERLVTSSKADLHTLKSQINENQFGWPQALVPRRAEGRRNGSSRREFVNALYRWLLPMPPETREQVMDLIRLWAETHSQELSTRRALTSAELLHLADGALIEVGAHTRSHPTLSRLAVEEQTEEIVSSKQYLEDLLVKPVRGFAYPNGKMTMETRDIVVQTGFTYACCTETNLIRAGNDQYRLSRLWPGDEPRDKFLHRLKLWM